MNLKSNENRQTEWMNGKIVVVVVVMVVFLSNKKRMNPIAFPIKNQTQLEKFQSKKHTERKKKELVKKNHIENWPYSQN